MRRHGLRRHPEPLGDPPVGEPLCHQREHFPLSPGQVPRAGPARGVAPGAATTSSRSTTVSPAATRSRAATSSPPLSDTVLEQVAAAPFGSLDQAKGIGGVDVLREDEHADLRGAVRESSRRRRDLRRRASGGMRMSTTAASGCSRSTSSSNCSASPASPQTSIPASPQQSSDALPKKRRVVGDHDAHGISTMQVRALRRAGCGRSVGRRAHRRGRQDRSEAVAAGGLLRRRRRRSRRLRTLTVQSLDLHVAPSCACACFATFASASATMK